MKLYFSPGACSFSPHVVMNELGLQFDLVKVDMKSKKLASGGDYTAINPKGYVPALELDNGELLTEGPAIVQYLADMKPELGLAPKAGTAERYRLMEMLNFITTEIHKGFSPLFNADGMVSSKEGNTQLRDFTKSKLGQRIGYLAGILAKQPYLLGDKVTVADVYLMTCLRWSAYVGYDLSSWPSITAFLTRMHDRPSVQMAIKAEGLKG